MSELNNPCDPPSPLPPDIRDTPPPYCRDTPTESLKDQPGLDLSWLLENSLDKMGNGAEALCDPVQKGYIANSSGGGPNPAVVYRYSKALRGADEGMRQLFSDIVVEDDNHRVHAVPIINATQERAVADIVQSNIRKDNSAVVDPITLPMLAIHSTGDEYAPKRYCYHKAIDHIRAPDHRPGFTVKERWNRDTIFGVARGIPINRSYTLYVWTLYQEDMNQIVEQIFLKFSPMAYIRVRGVSMEVGVRLDQSGNNTEVNQGDRAINVFKYQFNMTAETYIPQPLVRKKAVLDIKADIVEMSTEQVVSRLEDTVRDSQ